MRRNMHVEQAFRIIKFSSPELAWDNSWFNKHGSANLGTQKRKQQTKNGMRWCREIEALGSSYLAWLMVLEPCKTYSRTANKVKRVGTTTIEQELPSNCNKKELFWEQDLFLCHFFFLAQSKISLLLFSLIISVLTLM